MTERPRDRLGRPLPSDADPAEAAEAVPDVTPLTDEQVWELALGFLQRGLPFHAHEVFEQRWRTCPSVDREAWRALAQWGAALTHAARGNDEGARRLAERALATWSASAGVPSIPADEVLRSSCRALAEQGDR